MECFLKLCRMDIDNLNMFISMCEVAYGDAYCPLNMGISVPSGNEIVLYPLKFCIQKRFKCFCFDGNH